MGAYSASRSEWLLEIADKHANDCISSFNNGINILIFMPDAAGDENRVIVSAVDLARIESSFSPNAASPDAPSIPWWGRLIGWFVALSFPLLCVFAIGIRYAVRRKEYRVREAWKGFLCTLLIVSGLANLGALVAYAILRPASFNKQQRLAIAPDVSEGLELSERLPQFPTAGIMTSVELAARTKPLVFIVTPDIGIDPRRETLGMAQIGAGVLLMANDSGFLIGTNRHVIDPSGAFHFSAKDGEVMVISNAWEYARARVIARHQVLDLALLWVLRRGGSDRFRQPIAPDRSIPVGDPVFVVGHPQRLFFTLSNGLISRVDGDALQLSAPVSPGNSGGPVYDSYGNLLGIVTSKLDREITPNAENLNFATRADAFLDEAGWKFLDHGQERLRQFLDAKATH